MTFNTSFMRLGDGLVIRVEKLTMNELELRIIGEDHTLGNLIAKTALNHPNVQIAAYSIDHPLVGSPRIVLVTDGSKAPLDVLKEVINEIIDMSKELLNISEKMFEE